jgi:uncharacterized SAM-binding protein YcdF (DUF218 family)
MSVERRPVNGDNAKQDKQYRGKVLRLLAAILVLPALFWTSYVALRIVMVGERDDRRTADAIVVLGAREYSGWPSSPFAARLDHALSLYEQGLAPLVIVAGGDPEGDTYTEADAGARYLEHLGLPLEVLLTVGGNNTYENLREAEALAEREGLETVLVVSERFHMLRSLAMAEDLGMRAYGSPTMTSPRERNPAWRLFYTLREVAAYSAYSLLGLKSPTPA